MSIEFPFVVVATGLAFEARIANSVRSVRVCCARGPAMATALDAALAPGCRGILSFGIAGGLDPTLPAGTTLVASAVIDCHHRIATDESWSRALLATHPAAVHAPILGADAAMTDHTTKTHHFQRTGAAAVDMESHIAAATAERHGLPFAALRVIADPAGRHVPHSALCGMRDDGSADAIAVLRALMQRPSDIPSLIAIARDAWTARLTLSRCRLS